MIRLGVDLGARRVGVALHAEDEVPARPLDTVERVEGVSVVGAVAALVAAHRVEEVVVGLPLEMSGDDGPAARNARRFATSLARRVACPVTLWDERLTTVQAQRARTGLGRRGREGIDAEAAAILLQSYVDARRGGSGWDDAP